MRQSSKNSMMGTLFTMMLFLVFILCALFTVLTGGKVYENMAGRMEQSFTGSVALQYLANKVRQSDAEGQICVRDVEGTSVLELAQEVNGWTYITWIYQKDDQLCELFAGEDSGLGLADGIPVMECEGLLLSQEGNLLNLEITGDGGGRLMLTLRSAGGYDEEEK